LLHARHALQPGVKCLQLRRPGGARRGVPAAPDLELQGRFIPLPRRRALSAIGRGLGQHFLPRCCFLVISSRGPRGPKIHIIINLYIESKRFVAQVCCNKLNKSLKRQTKYYVQSRERWVLGE